MKRRVRRLLILTVVPILVVGFLSFKLFEVVLVYNWGWERVPDERYPVTTVHAPGWEDVGAEADAWLEDARAELESPALSAAVSVNGELVWAGVAGYADIDGRTPVSPDTMFRVGSSSKAVTAIAMGVLIDEGMVDLDAPLSHYVPDVSMPLASITTRQAMSHTAGVRDYGLCFCFPIWEYYSQTHYDSQRAALRPFEQSDLLFEPGQGFSYTSYGYNITGAVIESVAELSFSDFLAYRVLDPLELDGLRVDSGTPGAEDATFYELRDGTYKETYYVDNTNKSPSGGVMATPSSMVRLGHQMISPRLFSDSTRDLLVRHQPLADGQPNPQGYALGWRSHEVEIMDGTAETRVLHHHGVAYGAVSYFVVYPEHGVVVSIMMNRNQGSFGELPASLVNMFISQTWAPALTDP